TPNRSPRRRRTSGDLLLHNAFSRARGGAPFAALLATVLLFGRQAGAQTLPAPSASPSPPAAPNPLALRGSFRAYDFTRQNASTGIGGAGQVNQQSIELGLGLHADYHIANSPFTLGASYEFATPTNGCSSPVSHLSTPCGKLKAPNVNPDDSLPGFEIS